MTSYSLNIAPHRLSDAGINISRATRKGSLLRSPSFQRVSTPHTFPYVRKYNPHCLLSVPDETLLGGELGNPSVN
jgi:hypothetical protein